MTAVLASRSAKPKRLWQLFFVFCMLGVCWAQIFIDNPPSLIGYIQGSTAAFGTPRYGDYILARFFSGLGTNPEAPHCQPDYKLLPDVAEDDPRNLQWKKVVVVRRGGCPFAQKVEVAAMNYSAEAVVIVDNNPDQQASDIRMIIMAEDTPRKYNINIPSVLVDYAAGNALIGGIEAGGGEQVLGRLEWDIPNADRVTYTQWTSPALSEGVKFMEKFAPIAMSFGEDLDFRPRYWIFPMPKSANNMCSDQTGRFCSIPPEWGNRTSGRVVVEETVRQVCLWKESSKMGSLVPFWQYTADYPRRCPASRQSMDSTTEGNTAIMGHECSSELMKQIDEPLEVAVQRCYADEFEDILNAEKDSIAWSPTATMINDWRYAGPLEPNSVARALCTGFYDEPDVCRKVRRGTLTALGSPVAPMNRGVPWWVYLVSVFGAVGLVVLAILCYRAVLYKRLRNELRYEIFHEVKQQTRPEKEQRDKIEDQGAGPRVKSPVDTGVELRCNES